MRQYAFFWRALALLGLLLLSRFVTQAQGISRGTTPADALATFDIMNTRAAGVAAAACTAVLPPAAPACR